MEGKFSTQEQGILDRGTSDRGISDEEKGLNEAGEAVVVASMDECDIMFARMDSQEKYVKDFIECYKVRNSREALRNCLVGKINQSWCCIIAKFRSELGSHWKRRKCDSDTGERLYPVKPLDRLRVTALLNGWLHGVDYLDAQDFSLCFEAHSPMKHTVPPQFTNENCDKVVVDYDLSKAEQLILLPAVPRETDRCKTTSPGARRNLRQIFEERVKGRRTYVEMWDPKRGGIHKMYTYLLGENMMRDINVYAMDINRYLSSLLKWDSKHCYGLMFLIYQDIYLRRGEPLGTMEPIHEAAMNWIYRQKEEGHRLYEGYPPIKDVNELNSSYD